MDLRGGWELFFVSLTARKATIRCENLAGGELACRGVGVREGGGYRNSDWRGIESNPFLEKQ